MNCKPCKCGCKVHAVAEKKRRQLKALLERQHKALRPVGKTGDAKL